MADPVADFLAREQDMFADIEGGAAAPVGQPPADVVIAAAADHFDALVVAEADPPSVGGGDSGVDLASMDFQAPPIAPIVNGNGFNGNNSTGSSTGPSPVPSSMVLNEAENIRRWREEQKILLEKKDQAEDKKRNDWREAAKKELDDWYKQREATLKGTRDSNRKAEEDHLAAFGREQGESAQWDEIAKLCEAKAQKGGKDVSRLKSLLLHLKDQQNKQ